MKRLIVFIFLVILLCGINLAFVEDLTLDKIFPQSQVEIFTNSKTSLKINKIDNGMGEILFCNIENLDYILNQLDNVVGLSIKIYNKNKANVLRALKVKNLYNQNFGSCGWSGTLERIKVVKFKNVHLLDGMANFQCVEKDDHVVIGMPIILGSY